MLTLTPFRLAILVQHKNISSVDTGENQDVYVHLSGEHSELI